MKIAEYSTVRGAQKYADELAAVSGPHLAFAVTSHPYSFRYTVGVYTIQEDLSTPFLAYAGKRPRGGPRATHAVDSDGYIH